MVEYPEEGVEVSVTPIAEALASMQVQIHLALARVQDAEECLSRAIALLAGGDLAP